MNNCYLPLNCVGHQFVSDLKIMYPHQIKSQVFGAIMAKQKFYDLFSSLKVKCWQSGKNSYLTTSVLDAAGSKTKQLILKKCSEMGKTANLS